MSKQKEQVMSVRILPNTTSNPPGKLADAEVVFEADAGPLNGLKLIGFSIWERRATFTDTGRPATGPPSGVHGGQPPTPIRPGWAAPFGLRLPKDFALRAQTEDRHGRHCSRSHSPH
jgi:hypothetical protein